MADSFEVGEVAIFINLADEDNGKEVEVLTGIMPKHHFHCCDDDMTNGEPVHLCRIDGDTIDSAIPPRMLRKKKPPQEDESWAAKQFKNNWQPNQVTVPDQSHTTTIPESDHA